MSCSLFFLQTRAHEEVDNLTVIVKSVAQDIVADLRKTESLSVMSSYSPVSTLVQHLYNQGFQLLKEVESDQLLLDIIHSIQASIDITRYVFLILFSFLFDKSNL